MKILEKLYALYLLLPYSKKPKFLLSFLFGSKVKIFNYEIDVTDYPTILHLFAVKRYSKIFTSLEKNAIKISLDGENNFFISKQLDKSDRMLLALLDEGLRDGAYFIDEDHHDQMQYNKTIKIIQSKKIIETSDGVRFHLDDIGATVEAFVRRIHDYYSKDLNGKVVVDIGASVGDTPLYFAAKGAKVFAIEMTKNNFDAMLKNINPDLAGKIIPIHAAIGKDGTVQYYEDSLGLISRQGGAIFVASKYGSDTIKKEVQSMSLGTLRKKYEINHIDLLKLDCKGCEFFLEDNELTNIKTIKIEYYSLIKEHKVDALINLLKTKFDLILYKHTPTDTTPLMKHGNILAMIKK